MSDAVTGLIGATEGSKAFCRSEGIVLRVQGDRAFSASRGREFVAQRAAGDGAQEASVAGMNMDNKVQDHTKL